MANYATNNDANVGVVLQDVYPRYELSVSTTSDGVLGFHLVGNTSLNATIANTESFLSDIGAAIQGITGVDHVNITKFDMPSDSTLYSS
jgi:hypothetical protein